MKRSVMNQKRWLLFSAVVLGVGGVLDIWEDQVGGVTLSQTIRETARVHTPLGAVAVLGGLSLLSGVLGAHFVNGAVRVVGAAVEAAAEEFGGGDD